MRSTHPALRNRAQSRAAHLAPAFGPLYLPTISLGIACFGTLACAALNPARADTVIGPPAAPGGTIAVTPGTAKSAGTLVAIVSALDTSGNAAMARRALLAAELGLRATPGFAPAPVSTRFKPIARSQTAAGQSTVNWHFPLTGRDYQDFGKALKVKRALSLTVAPGDEDNSYSATAELYDTKTGGLIGLGRASSTITEAPLADGETRPANALTLQQRALDAAVQTAVFELSRTASFRAIVVSKPGAYQARLSAGEQDGVRAGARVEYIQNGLPVAFGTITDLGFGECVATVAPEAAFPGVYVNSDVRIVNNPTAERAIPSLAQADDREFARFEKSFGLAAGIAGAAYLLFR